MKPTNDFIPQELDLVNQLKRDEGFRLTPYTDSVGKLTIGVGRNLDDVGISTDEAEYMLANDIASVKMQIGRLLPWTANIDPIRLAVLHNMAFMGVQKLLGFKKMLGHIQNHDWTAAAAELMSSKYAQQVGARAKRLSVQLITGEWQ